MLSKTGSIKKRRRSIVLVGAGDVARRIVAQHPNAPQRWIGLSRTDESASTLRQLGILPIHGDLDVRRSLQRAAKIARACALVIYLAPPPNEGVDDPRMRRWIAARSKPPSRSPRIRSTLKANRSKRRNANKPRCVYISTTGVYGDRAGERVDETSALFATSARSKRRVIAERLLRANRSQRISILRAPGIYSLERLPIARLRAGTPALLAHEDVFTNHIHADDLANAAWLSLFRAKAQRVMNIVDDAELKMGEYFDQVAAATGLSKPPRLSRLLLQREVSPMLYSFMSESRRIDNARMKRDLRVKLRYPTPSTLLGTLRASDALQRKLL
jgi:nucleoside-diphosphate-sugar epimerase